MRTVFYIHGSWGDEYFCCFICVTLLWALHIVIKQQFFYIENSSWQLERHLLLDTQCKSYDSGLQWLSDYYYDDDDDDDDV